MLQRVFIQAFIGIWLIATRADRYFTGVDEQGAHKVLDILFSFLDQSLGKAAK